MQFFARMPAPLTAARLFLIATSLAVLGSGCKDSTLGPQLYGSIEGRAVDFTTGAPLPGVGITTSPPSGALVTDADGTFRIDDVPTGNYTITARRDGYQAGTAAISVQENRVTQATIFLQLTSIVAPPAADSAAITVEVTNFFNSITSTSRGDSVTVVVDYRVRNVGTRVIPSYDAYFRIVTPAGDFFQRETRSVIAVGQTDIGRFEKTTGGAQATAVLVDGFFIGGQRPAVSETRPAPTPAVAAARRQ